MLSRADPIGLDGYYRGTAEDLLSRADPIDLNDERRLRGEGRCVTPIALRGRTADTLKPDGPDDDGDDDDDERRALLRILDKTFFLPRLGLTSPSSKSRPYHG